MFYLDRLLRGLYFSSHENAKIISKHLPAIMSDSHDARRKEQEMVDRGAEKEERYASMHIWGMYRYLGGVSMRVCLDFRDFLLLIML